MTRGTFRSIAVRYGRSPGFSADFGARMVTTFASVSREAKPSPGKCFIAGSTPLASNPVANALLRLAVTDASNENVRPSWYMKEAVDDGTSATGARSLLMPAQASTRPVAFPWLAVVAV